MADSSNIDEDNNLEDNLSSEDWTIIYKKEPENNHSSKEQVKNNESLNSDTDSEITTEDICICALFDGKCNSKIEDIEIGEEVVEKETESDISIISEESESEQLNYNGTLESSNSQIVTKHQLEAEILSSNPASDGNLTSNALIIYSVIAMIFGIIIAGQIVEFRGDNSAYSVNNDIQEKLRELIGLKKKLNDLNDVKETLNQIRLSMPEMKKFKDQLSYKKHKRNKEKYFMNNDKYFENINDEYISNLNDYDDKLGMLEATYQNFCSVISKINSTDVELCKTPKILLNLINFKKNLKEVIKKTVEIGSQEKRLFVDIERRLDFISESLLFELKTLFFKFTLKIQERLNKMEYEMLNRFYYLYINENINHEFLNVFLDKSYFLNSCNGSNADPLMINLKWNVTQADKKRFKDKKKKSHEEMNKKAYKFNYKNYKGYKKPYDSKENHFYEKMYTQENFNKGEANNESWKRNKYENKEKYFEEEKKYNKHERSNNYKNDLNKKNKPIYSDDISLENNKKKSDFNKKVDNKSNHNYDCKFDNDKEERECKKKFHGKTNKEFDRKLKYNKENEVSNEADHKKKYNSREKNFEDEKNYDFTENDLKYVVNLENYSDKYNRYSEEKGRYKDDEEFILKIENFRDSKFVKYDDRSDKRKKYQPNGDWQINRGKAREKQRNSDWYFVRADSRQKARVVEVDEEETLNFSSSRKKYRGKDDDVFFTNIVDVR